ncbi:MAG TPA: trypsin-like peptidase domain-containing protein, partial [Rhodocyclaceae bacterium]|nr:trypsin-like peptidase domain-containing protein [Rhodocyclaceae bacterium]
MTLRVWHISFVATILILVDIHTAAAIMAGALPDTPAARVDPNVPSSPWAGVGSVVVNNNNYSGVAISRHYVLTAGHVAGGSVANPVAVQFVLNMNGDASDKRTADRIDVFPTQSYPYDDIALIHLPDPLPEGTPLYPIDDEPTALGTIYTLIGYGASGNGDIGISVGSSSTVKRKGENAIDLLPTTLDASGRKGSFYLYDFDGPTGNGRSGGPTLGNERETTVATGDSGSGAFVQVDG